MVDIRPRDAMDRGFLEHMLFEAFFWDPAWPRPTLSVSPSNFARSFYESEGFHKVGESGTSWTLFLQLGRVPREAAAQQITRADEPFR